MAATTQVVSRYHADYRTDGHLVDYLRPTGTTVDAPTVLNQHDYFVPISSHRWFILVAIYNVIKIRSREKECAQKAEAQRIEKLRKQQQAKQHAENSQRNQAVKQHRPAEDHTNPRE